MLSENTVKELQQIIKAQGTEINFEVASEIANQLVTYYDTLAKIYHDIKNGNDRNQ